MKSRSATANKDTKRIGAILHPRFVLDSVKALEIAPIRTSYAEVVDIGHAMDTETRKIGPHASIVLQEVAECSHIVKLANGNRRPHAKEIVVAVHAPTLSVFIHTRHHFPCFPICREAW